MLFMSKAPLEEKMSVFLSISTLPRNSLNEYLFIIASHLELRNIYLSYICIHNRCLSFFLRGGGGCIPHTCTHV